MTDLRKLSVSLTKHGAHKLATLLRVYDSTQVLEHLSGSVEGVNIELAQAKKNLSADESGIVPKLWDKARSEGEQVLDALVLLAIIGSHHEIIRALQEGRGTAHGNGVIQRGKILEGKAFTNVAHIIEQLGYATEHQTNFVAYDFSRLFSIPKLNTLAHELLFLKMRTARWTGTEGQLADALIEVGFHDALSASETFFRKWLSLGEEAALALPPPVEDLDFFTENEDDVTLSDFVFVPGHTPKKTGTVTAKVRAKAARIELLHNRMQTELVRRLEAEYGKGTVGTENASGVGRTKIDVVLKTRSHCWFYEIKTAKSVRSCVREAIPQLLEYAYWKGGKAACDRMIIVGPKPITQQAKSYLEHLRSTFGLKLYYEQLTV